MNAEDAVGGGGPINYHLELTPAQMKITHTALRSLLDDFGHEEAEMVRIVHEVLEKLPTSTRSARSSSARTPRRSVPAAMSL